MAPNVRVWRHQFVYGFVCGVLILSQLIAFDFFKGQGHSGDVMLALTFALVIRKPSYTPIWLVACAFFFADIMLNRPLGYGPCWWFWLLMWCVPIWVCFAI